MIQQILSTIKTHRFDLQNEKVLQTQISKVLTDAGIKHDREHHLSVKDIIDIYFPDGSRIGIEIKITGNAKSIYKQLERYCKHEEISQIILVTNKTIGLPKTINDKPAYIINLGKAWL